ncbi:MAG: 50S ribosomal protein L19 [Patescibacteria group bacterium]
MAVSEAAVVSVGPVYPEVVPGALVRVHQRIREVTPKGEEKERVQIFEGTVIGRKHGSEAGATITVRKISNGVGVEKIFPLHLPTIDKIEVKKLYRVRRAKLGYLRTSKKRIKEVKKVTAAA